MFELVRGNWQGSEEHLLEAWQEAEATNNTRLRPLVLQAQAELAMRYGDWQKAETAFQACLVAATNTEWYPSSLALYGHFLAVAGRKGEARTYLDKAAACPEPPGFGGDFYIPFLAGGYLQLDANDQAVIFSRRIQDLRGFMYYGNSVDRILGFVAIQAGDWTLADQAFENGLSLCQRAGNQPEAVAILYEQARAALMQSATVATLEHQPLLQRVNSPCAQARTVFVQYDMHRAVSLVDMLQEGIRQLDEHSRETGATVRGDMRSIQLSSTLSRADPDEEVFSPPGYVLDRHLTRREVEVLRLVAKGHTDREVAATLVVSPRTVNRHLSNIFVKLDVPGRAAAVAYAVRQGLV